jgi:hypothetical protein
VAPNIFRSSSCRRWKVFYVGREFAVNSIYQRPPYHFLQLNLIHLYYQLCCFSHGFHIMVFLRIFQVFNYILPNKKSKCRSTYNKNFGQSFLSRQVVYTTTKKVCIIHEHLFVLAVRYVYNQLVGILFLFWSLAKV